MIPEEVLRSAAVRSREIYVSCLEQGYDPENQHVYSPDFEKKIERLKRRAKHPIFYRTMRCAASIVLAILIIGGTWITVDTEARAAFTGWVKETYEMFFVYRFSGEVDVSAEKNDYRPAWIPDGYSEYMTFDENGGVTVLYQDEAGKRMKFGYIQNSGSTGWYVDTTDTIRSDSLVNGQPADLFTSANKATASIILWTDDQENSAFYVSGFFDEDDLIRIAESVSVKK